MSRDSLDTYLCPSASTVHAREWFSANSEVPGVLCSSQPRELGTRRDVGLCLGPQLGGRLQLRGRPAGRLRLLRLPMPPPRATSSNCRRRRCQTLTQRCGGSSARAAQVDLRTIPSSRAGAPSRIPEEHEALVSTRRRRLLRLPPPRTLRRRRRCRSPRPRLTTSLSCR